MTCSFWCVCISLHLIRKVLLHTTEKFTSECPFSRIQWILSRKWSNGFWHVAFICFVYRHHTLWYYESEFVPKIPETMYSPLRPDGLTFRIIAILTNGLSIKSSTQSHLHPWDWQCGQHFLVFNSPLWIEWEIAQMDPYHQTAIVFRESGFCLVLCSCSAADASIYQITIVIAINGMDI